VQVYRIGGAGGVGRHRSRDHTLTRSAATPLTVGAVLHTAELDAGKGTAATDQVDEQCRAATNQQLSHHR